MTWSNNNMAHQALWWSLYILEHSKRTFDKSASVQMDQLAYWVDADSAAIRRAKARSLAAVLDNMFMEIYEARYEGLADAAAEAEIDQARAVARKALVEVLVDTGKTMEALGEEVDRMYRFLGEQP